MYMSLHVINVYEFTYFVQPFTYLMVGDRFLLFQNYSDPDVTPNITCLLLLLKI